MKCSDQNLYLPKPCSWIQLLPSLAAVQDPLSLGAGFRDAIGHRPTPGAYSVRLVIPLNERLEQHGALLANVQRMLHSALSNVT